MFTLPAFIEAVSNAAFPNVVLPFTDKLPATVTVPLEAPILILAAPPKLTVDVVPFNKLTVVLVDVISPPFAAKVPPTVAPPLVVSV